MKRFWLLLLVFILPVQMSLAAVHLCDDGMPMATMSYAFEPSDASDVHQEAHQHSTDHGAEHLSDAGHGCNAFHGLMGQDGDGVGVASAANFISMSHLLPVPGAFSTRHERPQWLPA